jgi:hypothetical protein
MKFTANETIQLTEIYRRLNYFHGGNLETNLLYLAMPNEVKTLKKKGILKCSNTEKPYALNWYRLAEKGITLFKDHVTKKKLTEKENLEIWEGRHTKNFNTSLTQ